MLGIVGIAFVSSVEEKLSDMAILDEIVVLRCFVYSAGKIADLIKEMLIVSSSDCELSL